MCVLAPVGHALSHTGQAHERTQRPALGWLGLRQRPPFPSTALGDGPRTLPGFCPGEPRSRDQQEAAAPRAVLSSVSTPPWPCPGHSIHGEQSCSDLCGRGCCPRGAEGTEQGPSPWEVTAAAPLQEPTQAHSNSLGTLQMGAHCPSPGTRGHVASPRSAADGHQEQRQGPSW